MEYSSRSVPSLTIGFDLGDKESHLYALKFDDEVVADETVATEREALLKRFGEFPAARIAIEAGGQSQWVAELLESLGHEVIVANPRALGTRKQRRKNDRRDAEMLARRARSDPKELSPIHHRCRSSQYDLSVIRARDCVVRARTLQINAVRGLVKVAGERLPSCSSPAFAKVVRPWIPDELKAAVDPLLEVIEQLTKTIRHYDKVIESIALKKYPQTARLTQVKGVSYLTALAYILTLEYPERFRKSRSVGAFLGLVPALSDSGNATPQLKISKAGDTYLRRLLVNASHYVLGHMGPDTDIRRHGEVIAARGGKNAKKRAVIATARKLSVLLHRLWASGDEYDPLYNSQRKEKETAA